mmetsp:Transcript_44832/g.71629  ORF Transcript_44832/g.71629 Transcript_44832/m.71629 type:complete len:94 (-) Transcript_44832:307-588(-)
MVQLLPSVHELRLTTSFGPVIVNTPSLTLYSELDEGGEGSCAQQIEYALPGVPWFGIPSLYSDGLSVSAWVGLDIPPKLAMDDPHEVPETITT